MLESSREPIGFIARSCGFSGLNSFNKCFKQEFHVSPSDYRKHKLSQNNTTFSWKIPLEEIHCDQLIELCSKHHWLKLLLTRLLKNMGNDSINIEEIASYMCYESSNLNRKIKKLLGISTSTLILNLRIQLACEFLAIKKKSIADTAFLSGFYDSSHFSKQFKKVIGCTPGDFLLTPPIFPFFDLFAKEVVETKG